MYINRTTITIMQFLSTLSLRRATCIFKCSSILLLYFYPRSPCGERHLRVVDGSRSSIISIHALLAESDDKTHTYRVYCPAFLSTLSLRRATVSPDTSSTQCRLFLSTLSLRRATAKVHKTVGHFCAYETNFMGIASSC